MLQPVEPPSRFEQRKDVKVTIIVTKMVHTDQMHFKSVVQSLTGKESTTAEETVEIPAAVHEKNAKEVEDGGGGWETGEFEDMLKELPSIDELKLLWDD